MQKSTKKEREKTKKRTKKTKKNKKKHLTQYIHVYSLQSFAYITIIRPMLLCSAPLCRIVSGAVQVSHCDCDYCAVS